MLVGLGLGGGVARRREWAYGDGAGCRCWVGGGRWNPVLVGLGVGNALAERRCGD